MGQQSLYIICITCRPSSFCRRSILPRHPFLAPATHCCSFCAHTACTHDLIAQCSPACLSAEQGIPLQLHSSCSPPGQCLYLSKLLAGVQGLHSMPPACMQLR